MRTHFVSVEIDKINVVNKRDDEKLTSSMQLMFDLNATFLNYSTINNNCNEYDKQEYFKTTESQICHKMSPNKIIAQPTLEVCLNFFFFFSNK
ncbi:unnamed protein product [Wuchereria bancrofti]|uniref:Uncharacterized protein n=1 Tax=Wuchereria bancrofti TaxID=6293 RepID=A0A3P7EIM3_WUCBA|nr:unnamed protein product [Wuchereria bancrofti]